MARIALLSTAHIHTRSFLESIVRSSDGHTVVSIWDDVPERGRRHAEEFGCRFESKLGALINDPAVDGFLICSETAKHISLLENLVLLRKPVLCDKPLTTNAKDLKRLRKILAGPRGAVLSGYFMPYFGDHRAVQNLLKGDFFGKITRVRFRSAHHAAYGRWFDTPDLAWFTDAAQAGGGGFLDMGTHSVHLLRTLFGPVTEVFATIRNEGGVYPGVDDYGVAHLKFANGLLGIAEGGWTQTGGPRQLEICGSEKTLWHDGREYRIEGPNFPQESLYTIDAAPARVDRLVAAIRGEVSEEELENDLQIALDSVEIMNACYSSAEKGRWVKVSS